ncbi:MAG: GAF domain-containing protein, partial [Acidobacteriota bacterium]|nr:GAF domain-containing protein [Acidobacteriota bacterium]
MSKLQDYGRQELADFIENAAVGLHWMDQEGIIQWANRAELEMLGYSAKEYIGRHIAEFYLDKDVIDNILTRVSGNETLHNCEARLRRKDGSICYALISSTPYRENGKFIHTRCFTRDITERRNAEDALIEKAKLLAFAASVSETLIQRGTLERDLNKCAQLVVEHLGAAFARIWTLNEEENVLELQASAGMYTHLDGPHSRVPVGQFKIGLIAQERRPHLTNAVLDDPQVSDQEWARREGMAAFAGYPLIVDDRLVGVIAVFARHQLTQDALEALASVANNLALGIDQERTEQALREQTEIIETVNRLGRLLSAELDLQKLVQALTDAATQITGAQFGSFFYNVLDDRGASYMLYSLSGVPREHFAHLPMPRATDLFGPTFRGEGTIRIADVRQDHRYGKNSPYFGMPVGHLPVTSYLAVPVVSRSGEVIGGLFFAHSEAGVFTPQIERIIEGLASQAAVSIDNARLYESQKKSRAEAEEVSRMKDVFLATVSHELRTPLNAILGWASLLRTGRVEGEEANRALNIIENNARLQNQLITDLLDVSRIITGKMR